MNKDNFLGKWLSGDLSNEEHKAFENSKDYLAYKDILKGVERFERPVFDIEKGLKEQKIYNVSYKASKTSKKIALRIWMYSAAAVVLIIIGLKTMFFQDITIRTKMAQIQTVTLPDNSVVTLNAGSSLTYDKDSFIEDRELRLNGEAFFDVSNGSTFTVSTKNGKITVLGTEFDVYSRNQKLEVHCFEGKVSVEKDDNKVILTQGKGTKYNENDSLSLFEVTKPKPDWLDGKSYFHEVPLEQLIKELERQYDIKINVGSVDVKRIFTGFFNHDDLETALRTSFNPMNISYTFEGEKIIVLRNK